MGKAQGAPNTFLLCSLCQGEGEEIRRFLGKYLRFYLLFGKEGQSQSDSNHIGHSALLTSGAVTCHASQPGISHAQCRASCSPQYLHVFVHLLRKEQIFESLSFGSCSLFSPTPPPRPAHSPAGTRSGSMLQAPTGTSPREGFLPRAMLPAEDIAAPWLQAAGSRRG